MRSLERGGPPVGPFESAVFEEEETRLEPGDTLVLFSDGVTEAMSSEGEFFGDERVIECLEGTPGRTAEETLQRLLDAVSDFAAGAAQADDITALVVRYRGP